MPIPEYQCFLLFVQWDPMNDVGPQIGSPTPEELDGKTLAWVREKPARAKLNKYIKTGVAIHAAIGKTTFCVRAVENRSSRLT